MIFDLGFVIYDLAAVANRVLCSGPALNPITLQRTLTQSDERRSGSNQKSQIKNQKFHF